MDEELARRWAGLLHHRKPHLAQGEAIVPPITASATFHVPDHRLGGYSYARAANPTWDVLEAQLGHLEAAPVVAFPSGMAAISAALMAVVKAGMRIVIPSDGYYVTRLFAENFLKPFGVEV
ncbi:MAG: PLP-dependent transferase, partial [Paracoccaceae bacterium]